MTAETVGQRLRRLRLERGLSQRAIAEPGVSHAYISRIEDGTRVPSVKALRMLARKLGVRTEYLETGREITITDKRLFELCALAHDGQVTVTARPHDSRVECWTSADDGISGEAETVTEALARVLSALTAPDREEVPA